MCGRKSSKMAFHAKRAIIKLIRKQKLYTIYFGVSFKLFQSTGLLIIFSYDLMKQSTFSRKLKKATIFYEKGHIWLVDHMLATPDIQQPKALEAKGMIILLHVMVI